MSEPPGAIGAFLTNRQIIYRKRSADVEAMRAEPRAGRAGISSVGRG
jgi:hypothetical protein